MTTAGHLMGHRSTENGIQTLAIFAQPALRDKETTMLVILFSITCKRILCVERETYYNACSAGIFKSSSSCVHSNPGSVKAK